jgi:hypothetical protein
MKLSLRIATAPVAISLALTLTACGGSPRAKPVASFHDPLPPAPAQFGTPVTRPAPHKNEDARGLAARALGKLDEANARLSMDYTFYDDVQRKFGAQ